MQGYYNYIINRLRQDSILKADKEKCIRTLNYIQTYNDQKIERLESEHSSEIDYRNLREEMQIDNEIRKYEIDMSKKCEIISKKDDELTKIKIENINLQKKIIDIENEKNIIIEKKDEDYNILLDYDTEVHKKINAEKDELKIKNAILEYQLSIHKQPIYYVDQEQYFDEKQSKKRKLDN